VTALLGLLVYQPELNRLKLADDEGNGITALGAGTMAKSKA
jgi:hypothetical protein